MTSPRPAVSVVIPCRNEERYIGPCLDSLLECDYPLDRLEVLVVDGMSDDRTRDIVRQYAADHSFIRLVDNPKRITPCAMNAGVLAALGDVIMPMGAHAVYTQRYISRLVEALLETGADNVGGVLVTLPADDTATARALAIALSENSAPAGRLIGNHIVHPKAIDVGFAVEAEDGVLVPVLRAVDKRPLKELVDPYNKLVDLARQRRLPPEATGGSIATVTNFGTFGLTWATPIPLPEQTLVLGMGAGRMAPNWDAQRGQFVPVTEANLTLSFDHRVLDGGAAGRLLARIAALMGTPEKL